MRIDTTVLVERYKDNVFAAAFSVCRNADDAEDVVQETFLRYHTGNKQFDSEQHIRAWLLRVAVNKAKNINRSFWRRTSVPLEAYMQTLSFETHEAESLFEQVMKLPEKYRMPLHLFYYEDYSITQISRILHKKESTIRSLLYRARNMLKETLKEGLELD